MAKNVSTTIVLKVNGKDVENSFSGLSKEARTLESELRKLTPGTERFMRKAAELKEVKEHFSRVKSEIDAVSGKLKESEGFLGKFRSKLSDIGLSFGNTQQKNYSKYLMLWRMFRRLQAWHWMK